MDVSQASLIVKATDTSRVYGDANPEFAFDYTGFVNGDAPSSLTTPPVATTAANLNSTVGAYPINVSGATSGNYVISFQDGILTVNKASLSVKANDASRLYGDANPAFTFLYTGFKNQDGPSSLTSLPVATTTATVSSSVGNYPINVLGAASNSYHIIYQPGVLSIGKRNLTVTAEDKFIFQGENLPVFTSTYTGFVNNDQTRITGGPVYALSPAFTGAAGVYTITPSGLLLSNGSNYFISYVVGKFYVNPKGSGVKNVKPRLDCVEDLGLNHPSGFRYVANFGYDNPNSKTVYVPIGTSNLITASGTYSGSQPVVFLPGTGTFKIYFDGQTLKWTLITYNGNQKTSTSSSASSTSNKCSSNPIVLMSGATIPNAIPTQEATVETGKRQVNNKDLETKGIIAFPNPATNIVNIMTARPISTDRDVTITDMQGVTYRSFTARMTQDNNVEINISRLKPGVYTVKVKVANTYKQVKIMKQ